MKVLIIHHTDLDGAASAAIVKGALLKETKDIDFMKYSYGWSLNESTLKEYDKIYAVDVSFRDNPWVYDLPGLTWIDHHESIINDHPEIPGIRKVGVGACELCWQEFFPEYPLNPIIDYLGTYDVWNQERHDWQKVLDIQTGANDKYGNDPDLILDDLSNYSGSLLKDLESRGRLLNNYQDKQYKSSLSQFCGYIEDFHGLRVLVFNTTNFTSQAFKSLWNPDHFDAMMPWCYSPRMKKFRVSMYTDKPGITLNTIPGFNGHQKACGAQKTPSEWFSEILPYIEDVPKFEDPQ